MGKAWAVKGFKSIKHGRHLDGSKWDQQPATLVFFPTLVFFCGHTGIEKMDGKNGHFLSMDQNKNERS